MADEIVTDVEYRDVDGFPGYRVGSDGSIWSCRAIGRKPGVTGEWRRLTQATDEIGRQNIRLCRDGLVINRRVHRLVLCAFVGPCPVGMECCHNDGNPRNNTVENLRWDTRKANAQDMVRHGRSMHGTRFHGAKLTDSLIRAIFEQSENGEIQETIARQFGVSRRAVGMILNRQTWKHVTKPE